MHLFLDHVNGFALILVLIFACSITGLVSITKTLLKTFAREKRMLRRVVIRLAPMVYGALSGPLVIPDMMRVAQEGHSVVIVPSIQVSMLFGIGLGGISIMLYDSVYELLFKKEGVGEALLEISEAESDDASNH